MVYRTCIVTASLLLLLGCGSAGASGKGLRPSSPFTAADAKLFPDGIDLVGNPKGLDGRWAQDWASEMLDRVQRSDLVALVTVDTLRTDVTPEQRTTYWLDAQVKDVWKGSFDESQLSLPSSDSDVGFGSVDQRRNTVLKQSVIVLAKWEQGPNGTVRPRWQVTPASQEVIATVRAHLQQRAAGSQDRVIEREYRSTK
jgi:hypothetical protein